MVINNYVVTMNAQYFNLKNATTETEVTTQTDEFNKNTSSKINALDMEISKEKKSDSELSKELSKALLKNLRFKSKTTPIDRVEVTQTYEEKQALNFQVQALIQTDTQELQLSVDVSLSRSFIHKSTLNYEELVMQLTDPLVLSLNGSMPTLSTDTFAFDIDSDGQSNQISKLGKGSGFLAFDKNSNGKIENGNELFGTKSGNGFSDLRVYDDDKNGWIDENDAIFDKLRIWKKEEDEDTLLALGEVGIGAIFLGNATTPFELKSDLNSLLGEMRSSGIFLYENGTAGIISQIDLAVNPQAQNELDKLKKIQKDSNLFTLANIYNEKGQNTDTIHSTDSLIKNIDDKIKNIETKISHADDTSKPALQAQIIGLQAQKLAILARELK